MVYETPPVEFKSALRVTEVLVTSVAPGVSTWGAEGYKTIHSGEGCSPCIGCRELELVALPSGQPVRLWVKVPALFVPSDVVATEAILL